MGIQLFIIPPRHEAISGWVVDLGRSSIAIRRMIMMVRLSWRVMGSAMKKLRMSSHVLSERGSLGYVTGYVTAHPVFFSVADAAER